MAERDQQTERWTIRACAHCSAWEQSIPGASIQCPWCLQGTMETVEVVPTQTAERLADLLDQGSSLMDPETEEYGTYGNWRRESIEWQSAAKQALAAFRAGSSKEGQ
jgi:hypothetical protein